MRSSCPGAYWSWSRPPGPIFSDSCAAFDLRSRFIAVEHRTDSPTFGLQFESDVIWILYSLASSFDLFSFWTILLLAVGISVAARKFALSKALVAVVLPWGVLVVVKAAWTNLFG